MLSYNEAHTILSKLSEAIAETRRDIEAVLQLAGRLQRRRDELDRVFLAVERLTGPQKDSGGVDLAALERCGPEPVPQPKRTPWVGH